MTLDSSFLLPSLAGLITYWIESKVPHLSRPDWWLWILRFSCLHWLDWWLIGSRVKFRIYLAFIGRIDDFGFSVSLAFIGWTDDLLDAIKILRFSCLHWLDSWLIGSRIKFRIYLAFIGRIDDFLDFPFLLPSLAGWWLFGLRLKFPIYLAFID